MKKFLAIFGAMAISFAANAQDGTVNFANSAFTPGTGVLDAPVFDVDGTTPLPGAGFTVGLYGGATGGSLSLLGTTTISDGYFSVGNAVSVTGVTAGGAADIQVKVFNGSDFASSMIRGESTVFSVNTGNAGSPPSSPANLFGLTSFSVMNVAAVPEPTTVALGVMGGLGLLFRRRKS